MGGRGGVLRRTVQIGLLNTVIMKMFILKAEGTFVAPLSHSWHFPPGQGAMKYCQLGGCSKSVNSLIGATKDSFGKQTHG